MLRQPFLLKKKNQVCQKKKPRSYFSREIKSFWHQYYFWNHWWINLLVNRQKSNNFFQFYIIVILWIVVHCFQRRPKVIIRSKLSVHNSTSREDYWHHQKVHNHSVKTCGVLLHNTWRDFCNVLNVTWWGINIRNPLQSFLNYLNSYYLIVPFHVTYNSLTNKPSSHLNIPQETISVLHDL